MDYFSLDVKLLRNIVYTEFSLVSYLVQQPKHVEGMVSASKTSVQFTIIPPDGLTVDNYTLLYCHGHLVNGLPDHKYCKVRIKRDVMFYTCKTGALPLYW